jgi:branched-chain amino acid transport system ATP-binding protein
VAIGRALMSKPDILMLDEPSLGLSPRLTSELFKSLQRIGATGMGILLVEQNARQSLAIADRGYLLENGHIVGENSAANLLNDPAVQHAYLGGAAAKGPAPARQAVHTPVMPVAHTPEPHVAPVIPTLPPMGGDAASIARGIGDLVARAAASQAGFVRDGGARAATSLTPPANGFHPTAERDVQSIIAEMEAAARRARLIGSAEAKLPPAKSQLSSNGAKPAQGGD